MSETARDKDTQSELIFSDLENFGRFLALGQFNKADCPGQVAICRTWLVAQHAEALRWVSSYAAIWPPFHEKINELRSKLEAQNKQIDSLCSGPYSFLSVAGSEPPEDDPPLYATYRDNVIQLFNTLLRYDNFAKIYDSAYRKAEFTQITFDDPALDAYRIELSKKLESLAETLKLMTKSLL